MINDPFILGMLVGMCVFLAGIIVGNFLTTKNGGCCHGKT